MNESRLLAVLGYRGLEYGAFTHGSTGGRQAIAFLPNQHQLMPHQCGSTRAGQFSACFVPDPTGHELLKAPALHDPQSIGQQTGGAPHVKHRIVGQQVRYWHGANVIGCHSGIVVLGDVSVATSFVRHPVVPWGVRQYHRVFGIW